MPETFQPDNLRTRVLIYSYSDGGAKLTRKILGFHNLNVDWHPETPLSGSDFLVFCTADPREAAAFKPSIALASNDISTEDLHALAEHITSGGVLIYPEAMTVDLISGNFFRKILYQKAETEISGSYTYLLTEMGQLPVVSLSAEVLNDLEGIKLLCAQFGIMENEFYSALAEII